MLRAEGSFQMGIQTLPEREPLKEFQWGLETLALYWSRLRLRASAEVPSAFCPQHSCLSLVKTGNG